ncbi:MAG: hypothetical protein JXA30_01290, partial [Deltaproteobacteria bacterium]|nr:hypothetical protein [Deltaproteobacteria bacterium]
SVQGGKQVGGQVARKTERARRAGEDGTCSDGCRWKRTKQIGRESAKLYVCSGSTQGPNV